MTDMLPVLWKERRELMGHRGLRGKLGMALNIVVFGVVMPVQFGPSWVTSPMSAIVWSWVPMFLVMMVITDAFAGERERHTLETLLASRLSNDAILFGKLAAAVGYAGIVTASSVVLGLVTTNTLVQRATLLLYPASTVVGMIVFGTFGAILIASIGILISLRASSVRNAEQLLGGTILTLLAVPFGFWRLLSPESRAFLANPGNEVSVRLGVVSVFAVLAVGTLALARRQFDRARMIESALLE
jgi:ABC-2 type transport system permease protein